MTDTNNFYKKAAISSYFQVTWPITQKKDAHDATRYFSLTTGMF